MCGGGSGGCCGGSCGYQCPCPPVCNSIPFSCHIRPSCQFYQPASCSCPKCPTPCCAPFILGPVPLRCCGSCPSMCCSRGCC